MDEKELIITTTKEIFLKALEVSKSSPVLYNESTNDTTRLGENFKALAKEISKAVKST